MSASSGDRRSPGRRPGRTGRSGAGRPRTPGRPTGSGARLDARQKQLERRRAQRGRAAAGAQDRAEEKRRSRLTGRAAILVLVLAVLAVSYASSLRAYLQQRHQIDTLEAQIAERKDSIEELERERERWDDPAYVAQQARERFGYVEPGETPYVVVDADGEPLTDAELDDPATVGTTTEAQAWFDPLWESVKVAGDPPTRIAPPPEKRIDGRNDGGD